MAQRLRGLAAPPAVRCAIALVALMQLSHVFLRSEHYPFSAVTMFSDYLPAADPARPRPHSLFFVDGEHGLTPISFLREGSPWSSRYLHLDYKAGWVLGTFAQDTPDNTRRVAALLARAGARNARPFNVELDLRGGTVQVRPRGVSELARR